jgi:small-conductance mechanosensitive channel
MTNLINEIRAHHWWFFSAVLVVALLAALWVPTIVFELVGRLRSHKEGKAEWLTVLGRLRAPLRAIFVLAAAGLALGFAPLSLAVIGPARKVLLLAWIACVAWLLVNLIYSAEAIVMRRFDVTVSDNLRARRVRTQLQMLRRFSIFLIMLLAVAAMLFSFTAVRAYGTGLFASAGLGALVLATAARSTLANLLAGLQIAVSEPIRIDEVVVVEGEWGKIEEITTTYVQVYIWDQRRLILPLSYFIEKPFQNWTRESAQLLGTAFLYVDYSVPAAAVRARFSEFLKGNPLWDGRVDATQVTDLKEKTIEIRLLMSAADSGKLFDYAARRGR